MANSVFHFISGRKDQIILSLCKKYPSLTIAKAELILFKSLGLSFAEIQDITKNCVNEKTFQNYIREFNLLTGNLGVKKTTLLKFIPMP